MQPTPQKTVSAQVPSELAESLSQLEGRIPVNELALRVVRAAAALPGVAGARLWRIAEDEADVWAEIGALPAKTKRPTHLSSTEKSAVPPTVWTGALGSDDFRMRILEVHGEREFPEGVQSQLA